MFPRIKKAVTNPKIRIVSGSTAKINALEKIFGSSDTAPIAAAIASFWAIAVAKAARPIANPADKPSIPVVDIIVSATIICLKF